MEQLSYIVWNIHPEVFEGFIAPRWYGVCWSLGIVLGQRIMIHIYKKEEIPVSEVDMLTLYAMLGGVIGARFGHILFYSPIHYLHHPVEILPIQIEPYFQFTGLAGLASHGGIVGALLALYVYNRKFRKSYLWLLDRLIIAGAALGAFIRVGNLMNSEMIGTPSPLPWAFAFTQVDQIPRHPSQLYEALFYLVVSFVMYLIWKSGRFNTAHGFIFGMGIALIFALRFLVEFVKEDQAAFEEQLTLNMGQMLSIPLIVGGAVLMIWSRNRNLTPIQ